MSFSFSMQDLFKNLSGSIDLTKGILIAGADKAEETEESVFADETSIASITNLLMDAQENNKSVKIYDDNGNSKSEILKFDEDDDGIIDYCLTLNNSYDEEGNLSIQQIAYDSDNDGTADGYIIINSNYDEEGNLQSQTLSSSEDKNSELTVNYNYDENSDVQSVDAQLSSTEINAETITSSTTTWDFIDDITNDAAKRNIISNDGKYYVKAGLISSLFGNAELILQNVYNLDIASDEGQEVLKALAEKNPDSIDIDNPNAEISGTIYLVGFEQENKETVTSAIQTTQIDTYEVNKKGDLELTAEKETAVTKNESGLVVDIQSEDSTTRVISNDHTGAAEALNISTMEEVASILDMDELDGVLEGSYQGTTGNCYALSTLNAISYTEAGKEFLSQAIEYNDEGYVTVHYAVGDINLTYDEIAAAKESALYTATDTRCGGNGDDEMVILQLALEKVYDAITNNELKYEWDDGGISYIYTEDNISKTKPGKSSLGGEGKYEGGFMQDVFNYVTGSILKAASVSEVLSRCKNKNCVGVFASNEDRNITVTDTETGEKVTIVANHAYAIKDVYEDYDEENNKIIKVVITNPHNSGEEITISADDLKNKLDIDYIGYQYLDSSCGENWRMLSEDSYYG